MIVYICSKYSRSGNEKNINYIDQKLQEIYPDIVSCYLDEIDKIEKDKVEKVIFNGGDGVFHQVINHFKDYLSQITFGYIPTGTANDIGKTLGIKSIDDGLAIIKEGIEKEEGIIEINDDIAVYAISVGEMSRVSIGTLGRSKKHFGKLIYKIKGIRYLFSKKKEIRINGELKKIKVAIIVKSKYLGGVKIGKSIDDNIHLFLIKNIFDVINLFVFNRFHKIKGIICNDLEIESDSIWCVDGEKADYTMVRITKSDKKIKMLSKNA